MLGITALLLGLIPVSALGNVGLVSADDSEPPVIEPEELEEPEDLEEPKEDEELEEPPAEDPLKEEEFESLALESNFLLLSLSTSVGPTDESPEDLGLPEDQNAPGYQDDCDQPGNDCEKAEGGDLGDVNDVGEGETFNNDASVVVIKAGNEEFFFSPDGPECDTDVHPYCVIFNGDGTITVIRNEESRDVKDISNIQFWNPPDEDPCAGSNFSLLSTNGQYICGCPDPEALNYNPEATNDDGSCEYDVPGGGPGPGPGPAAVSIPETGDPLLIPVTGSDLNAGTFAELQLMLRSLGALFLGSNLVIDGISKRKTK